MSLFQSHFFSTSLGQQVCVNVILPQPAPGTPPPEHGYPTLYLLHGLSDDHMQWLRATSIERYVAGTQLAVVMPAVHRSFYQDMRLGVKYWSYVSEELPALVRHAFPLSARREDNFAAGLSMGGYGAFQLGLRRPENYAAVASLSGALDLRGRFEKGLMPPGEVDAIFDPAIGVPETSDLMKLLASNLKNGVDLPRLYAACGTEDFLWEDNVRFRDFAKELGVPLTWEQGPGAHDWGYWDMMIQDVLRWLNVPKL